MSTRPASLPLSAYLALPVPDRTWVIDKLIPTSGIINVFAAPKQGKSFWTLDMARAVSQGDPSWMGHTIPTQARVLYLQLDTPRPLWIERFQNLQAAGIDFTTNEVTEDTPDPCDFLRILDMDAVPPSFNILEPAHKKWLNDEITAVKPDLLILDTLREIHDQDEDKSGPMKALIGELISTITPADGSTRPAVVIITHSRKENPKFDGGLMQESRGSNYLAGRCDTVIRLKGKENSDVCQLIYKGRQTGHMVKVLNRNKDTILWELKDDPGLAAKIAWKADVAFIARHPDYKKKSQAEKGRILNEMHPDKKHSTCVAALNRYKG